MEAVPRLEHTATDRRGFSIRLFRYVLKDFSVVLVCFLGGCFLFFVVFSLMDELGEFLDTKSTNAEILQYFVFIQADNILRILPISLLLATVKCLSGMVRNNEMSALRAAGVSVLQACMPFLLVGVLFACIQFVSTEIVAPRARRTSRRIRERVDNYGSIMKFKPLLAYRNNTERRTWAIRSLTKNGGLSEVFLRQQRKDGSIDWELLAKSAVFVPATGEWEFHGAELTRFDADGLPDGAIERSETRSMPLSERPTGIQFYFKLQTNSELSARQIYQILNEPSLELPDATRRMLWTTFFDNLFFPLSCIIAILLAIPQAVQTRRSGNMRGFVFAAALLVGFYLTNRVFLTLGNQGILWPPLAAGLPSLLFLAWGSWQVMRKL